MPANINKTKKQNLMNALSRLGLRNNKININNLLRQVQGYENKQKLSKLITLVLGRKTNLAIKARLSPLTTRPNVKTPYNPLLMLPTFKRLGLPKLTAPPLIKKSTPPFLTAKTPSRRKTLKTMSPKK